MKSELKKYYDLIIGIGQLSKSIIKDFIHGDIEWKLVFEQVYQIGYKSLPLVLITAFSTGMVMAIQFGYGLERFGGQLYVPKIVTLSMLREMGPVFTSIMLAARIGAGIASEIGSMTVTQQIDAIRALGTSPIKKIVSPRVIGSFIALPLLIAISDIIGFLGGMVVGLSDLNFNSLFYIAKATDNLDLGDYFSGFCKGYFFALIISLIACYYGLNVSDGTKGVGKATTRAVVASCIMVFVSDFFLTKLFLVIEKWA